MYIVGIPLDCGHRLTTTIATIRENRGGLWYCWECKTGNHVEILETHPAFPDNAGEDAGRRFHGVR